MASLRARLEQLNEVQKDEQKHRLGSKSSQSNRMTGAFRKKEERELKAIVERRAEILKNDEQVLWATAHYWACGYRGVELAAKIGIDSEHLPALLGLINAEWRARRREAVNVYVERQLVGIDVIISKAMDGYERSRAEGVLTEKEEMDGDGTLIKTTRERRYRGTGDTKFLDVALKAMQDRAEILGIRKLAVEHSGRVDVNVNKEERDQKIQEMRAIIKEAQARDAQLQQVGYKAIVQQEAIDTTFEQIDKQEKQPEPEAAKKASGRPSRYANVGD